MAEYIKNAQLQKEMIICKGKGKLTKKGENYLMLIADRISRKFQPLYTGMSDNFYDCKMEALTTLLTKWDKYDTYYDNPLAFFTEVYKRAMSGAHSKIVLRKSNFAQETVEFVRFDYI